MSANNQPVAAPFSELTTDPLTLLRALLSGGTA
jgi:hypothetical protein